ncbi:MAG: iron chelate uptake ABC transporter family permease subunit, partial [Priestia megaterium]
MKIDNQRFIPFLYKLIGALLVFIIMFGYSMIFGAADISIKDVWLALSSSSVNEQVSIIRDIRLPREIAAVFVGAALSVSGAIMQGMT